MKTTKTIGYTIAKLDRNYTQKPTLEQRIVKAMQKLERLYRKVNYICSKIVTKNPKVAEYQEKMRQEREELIINHLTLASRRKRAKVMYSNWGHEPEPTTQQVINDLRFGRL